MQESASIQELVNAYISAGYGDPYCDDCVEAGIEISNLELVSLITSTLATTDRFNRRVSECAICGAVTSVTSRA